MPDEALAWFVKETAEGLGVTGAAVGVWADGREVFASHGVTSVENPLPVRPDTLFLIASVTKTFTATAVMRPVADGGSRWMRRCGGTCPNSCWRTSGPRIRSPCLTCSVGTTGHAVHSYIRVSASWWGEGALTPNDRDCSSKSRLPVGTAFTAAPGDTLSDKRGGAGGAGRGGTGGAAREGHGGQVSWTQAPVTRRRASWAGVAGFWQRAQGSLVERAVLASEPSGGSPTGPRPIGPESVTGRPAPPGQK